MTDTANQPASTTVPVSRDECRHQRVWVVDLETRKVYARPCEACGRRSPAVVPRAS